MRNILQTIGIIISIVIAFAGYGLSIYKGIKSKLSIWKLYEKLMFTSALSILVLIIFVIISLLF